MSLKNESSGSCMYDQIGTLHNHMHQSWSDAEIKYFKPGSARRSRSAERLRGGLRPGAPVIQVAPTGPRSR